MKSVQIRSFFWSLFFRIRTKFGKIRTRKNFVFGHFSHRRLYKLGVMKIILLRKFSHCILYRDVTISNLPWILSSIRKNQLRFDQCSVMKIKIFIPYWSETFNSHWFQVFALYFCTVFVTKIPVSQCLILLTILNLYKYFKLKV